MFTIQSLLATSATLSFIASSAASGSNVAVYWVVTNGGQGSGPNQKRLSTFCDETDIDIIPIGFLELFPQQGNGFPKQNFGNACWGGSVYSGPGSDHAADQLYTQCPTVQEDIPYCQAKGKKIVLSLGGAARDYQLTGKDAGIEFADLLWGAYGPLTDAWKASNGIRPLDRGYSNTTSDTIDIDGFDFDIEHTSTDQQHGYIACIHRLRALFATSSKKYLITGAPQCYLPEVNMGSMIAQAQFDILWIQFYNNPSCSVRNFAENNIDINYNIWKSQLAGGASSGAQLYIGLPGAPSEGTGCGKSSYGEYISAQDADRLINKYQSDSSFGGVMLWEATVALNNECNCKPYYSVIKDSLKGISPPSALSACPVTSTTISATSSTASSSLLPLSTSSSVPVTSTILSSSSSSEIPTSLSTSASSTSSSAISTSSASSSEIATPSITSVSSASSTALPSSSDVSTLSSISTASLATSTAISSSSTSSSEAVTSSSLSSTALASSSRSASSFSTTSSVSPSLSSSAVSSSVDSPSSLTFTPTLSQTSSSVSTLPSSSSSGNLTLSSSSATVTSSLQTSKSSGVSSFATPSLSTTSTGSSAMPSSLSILSSSSSKSSSSATESSKFPTFTPPYGNVTSKPTFTSSRASHPSTVISDDFPLPTSSRASNPSTVISDEFPLPTSSTVISDDFPLPTSSGASNPSTVIRDEFPLPTSSTVISDDFPLPTSSGASNPSTVIRDEFPLPTSSTVISDDFPLTTSTLYTTKTGTVTKCPATVTNCPLGSVTTETIALYTTICPVSQTNNGGVPTSIPAISAQSENQAGYTTSTVYTSKIYTITACAPGVNCAGTPGSVVTELIPLYTTVCPITQGSNGGIPTSVPGLASSLSPPGVSAEYTTSTIYTTKFSTVTACAPGGLCQGTPGSVLTEVIPLSTTVVPLPQNSFTTYITIQVASAVSTPIGTPLAPYPTPSKGSNKSPYGSGTGTAYSYPLKPTGTSVPSIQVVEINSVAPSFSKTGGGIKAVAPTGTPISPSATPSLISSNSASGFGSSFVLVMVSAVLVSALMM
ncbi:hypothetical protein HYFRA_00007150 [Hymenoscyphus fraxineus]|uniref:chitinase n=1 Tax=Hymenoscyphus fraxineus TaxID=746836 RepID=A0A9N9KVL5_9HELO|nr:hypothetical protein HYFRA_00007150 [Hymenoscyphus fraxineus]